MRPGIAKGATLEKSEDTPKGDPPLVFYLHSVTSQ